MKTKEHQRIVRQIIDGARPKLIRAMRHAPDHWDGHQIRHFIADYFATHYCLEMSRSERREFNNDIRTISFNDDES